MAPDENTPIKVSLTLQEAIGIIGDLHHMIRLNRATSREEEAAWGRARSATMRKLIRALEDAGQNMTQHPNGRIGPG